MSKTVKRTRSVNKSRKNVKSRSQYNQTNQQTILLKFLATMNMVKLFHWKTHSFSTHKATDEVFSQLSGNIDTFVETMMGKHGNRVDLSRMKSISMCDVKNVEQLRLEMNKFKMFLVNIEQKLEHTMSNTDLLNIRDEMLGNVNQFLYLLTLN